MKQKELKRMIEACVVETVTLFRPVKTNDEPIGDWEIWAEGIDGDNMVRIAGNRLETERGGAKTYSSIDRAHQALRALGWKRSIVIEG